MVATDELNEILFLDIETVPACRTVDEVPEDLREIWIETHGSKKPRKSSVKATPNCDADSDEEPAIGNDSNYGEAGLHAEFGKIICISLGRFDGGTKDEHLKVHSLYSDDERKILSDFDAVLNKYSTFRLCAHNGKGFDFPFLGRRFLINQMPLPSQLNIMGKKPWDVPHIDTMDLWAFGSRSSGVKLKLLCAAFGIPSPKDDISGADVRRVYYEKNDLPRIVKYCEKDVVSLAKVYKKICSIE